MLIFHNGETPVQKDLTYKYIITIVARGKLNYGVPACGRQAITMLFIVGAYSLYAPTATARCTPKKDLVKKKEEKMKIKQNNPLKKISVLCALQFLGALLYASPHNTVRYSYPKERSLTFWTRNGVVKEKRVPKAFSEGIPIPSERGGIQNFPDWFTTTFTARLSSPKSTEWNNEWLPSSKGDAPYATILLPDTLGGMGHPREVAFDSIDNKVYAIGDNGHCIVIIDPVSYKRIGRIATGSRNYSIIYVPTHQKVYCANYDSANVIVVDCLTDNIIADIPTGNNPYILMWASVSDKIYCSNVGSNNVTVIDPATNTVIKTVSVADVYALLCNPSQNKIYCAGWGSAILTILDGLMDTVIATLPIKQWFPSLAWNPTYNKVYCGKDSTIFVIDGIEDTIITTVKINAWVAFDIEYDTIDNKLYCAGNNSIIVIDGNTNTIAGAIGLPAGPNALSLLAWNKLNDKLYTTIGDGHTAIINCATNSLITTLPSEHWPLGAFWEEKHNQAWIANTGSSNVPGYSFTTISGTNNLITGRPLPGLTPFVLASNNQENKIYCAPGWLHKDEIAIINCETNKVDTVITGEDGGIAIICDSINNKVYCANFGSNSVTVVDGAFDTVIKNINVGNGPGALCWNKSGNKIYCANTYSNSISVIDANNDNVSSIIPVGTSPWDMVWNSINNKVYCVNTYSDNVTIINSATDNVITTIGVGVMPSTLVWNSINNKIYCVNCGSQNITVIDGSTDAVLDTIVFGVNDYPGTIAYNPVNNKIYCANGVYPNGDIIIIDGTADTVIARQAIPGGPYALLYNPLDNSVYCAYVNSSQWVEEVAVIDGETNLIVKTITTETSPTCYMWGLGQRVDCPYRTLALNTEHNLIYMGNFFDSRVSVISGEAGIEEQSPISNLQSPISISPNPCIRSTTIRYYLPRKTRVSLKIYDLTGRAVSTLVDGEKNAGNQIIKLDSGRKGQLPLPYGIYFVKLVVGDFKSTKKLIVLR